VFIVVYFVMTQFGNFLIHARIMPTYSYATKLGET
jgi:hypothetical protein